MRVKQNKHKSYIRLCVYNKFFINTTLKLTKPMIISCKNKVSFKKQRL